MSAPQPSEDKLGAFLQEQGVIIEDAETKEGPPTGSRYSARYIDQNWAGSAMGSLPPAQWPAWTQIPGQDYSDVSLWIADGGT